MAAKKDQEPDGASEVTQTPQEAGGIERTAEPEKSKVEGAEVVYPAATGRVVTTSTPSASDEDSWPHGTGAQIEDPPVRTGRPDVPIAESLASGAGQHVPPDPGVYRPDGRIREIVEGD